MRDKWEALRNNVWRTSLGYACSRRGPWGGGGASAKACARHCIASTTTWSLSTARLLQSAGWEGAVDAQLLLHRLRQRLRLHRRESRQIGSSRSPRSTARCCEPRGPSHGKSPDERIRDPRADVHAVRVSRHRHRGQEAGSVRTEEPTDDPVGPADPSTFGKEVVGTTLEHVTISYTLARGRLLPRRRPDHPALARQRYQHRGHLCDRLVRRAAGEEHHPAGTTSSSSPATTRQPSRSSTSRIA